MSTDQHLINNDLGIPDEKRAYEIYMITKTWLNLTIIYFTKALTVTWKRENFCFTYGTLINYFSYIDKEAILVKFILHCNIALSRTPESRRKRRRPKTVEESGWRSCAEARIAAADRGGWICSVGALCARRQEEER